MEQEMQAGTFVSDGHLTIRALRDRDADMALMARWRSDARVLAYYGGRDRPLDLEAVKRKYGPRARGESPVQPCLIIWQDRPIGYLQFYALQDAVDERILAWYGADIAPGAYGFDIFIGEVAFWDRGLGTRTVRLLWHYLCQEHGASRVIVDPAIGNARAIRCYEKAGFYKVKSLIAYEEHEGKLGDNWLMVRECARVT